MNIKRNQKGFTLIEVVLVLAIGGLIFLLAFLAFQQVSINRRDTQRRSDAGRILAEAQNFSSDTNSGGALTLTITDGSETAGTGICTTNTTTNPSAGFFTKYLCKDGKFYSPSGKNYNTLSLVDAAAPGKDQIKVTAPIFGSTIPGCDGADVKLKVEVGLEKGVACRDQR